MKVAVDNILPIDKQAHAGRNVLIVEDDAGAIAVLEAQLLKLGHRVILAASGNQARALLERNYIDLIFMKTQLSDIPGCDLVRHIKDNSAGIYIPVVLLVTDVDNEMLLECMKSGADDFIFYSFSQVVIEATITAMEQLRELKHSYKESVHEQVVGNQILKAALSARNIEVEGMEILSRSAAIFSGDLVLSARSPQGDLHVLLADFTGHGLSAAIGILPVADMFSVMTEKGFRTEKILKDINKKLHTLLPTGMFMSACMLKFSSDQCNASVWNCGMPDVYLIDPEEGEIKRRIKSTHIPLGIIEEIDKNIECETLDILDGDQFIMYSDGLTDVVDSTGKMFSIRRLENLMVRAGSAETVFDSIVSTFDQFFAEQELLDDVTLVSIPYEKNMMQSSIQEVAVKHQGVHGIKPGWHLMIELSGSSLRNINPVQLVLDQCRNMGELVVSMDELNYILSVLYDNALNHGVLGLQHESSSYTNKKSNNHENFNKRIDNTDTGFVRIELQPIKNRDNTSLLIRLEDSGNGFDHVGLMSDIRNGLNAQNAGSRGGISVINEICQSLHYLGRGNRVEAIISSRQHSGVEI